MRLLVSTLFLFLIAFYASAEPIIDEALKSQGGDLFKLNLPDTSFYYRLCNRNPLVERLLNRPLQMPNYARMLSRELKIENPYPHEVFKKLHKIWGGAIDVNKESENSYQLLNVISEIEKGDGQLDEKKLIILKEFVSKVPKQLSDYIAKSLFYFNQAVLKIKKWRKDNDAIILKKWKDFYFYKNGAYDFFTTDERKKFKTYLDFRSRDNNLLYESSYLLCLAGSVFSDKNFLVKVKSCSDRFSTEYVSSIGKIVISGKNDDEHSKDAAYLIDLGGNDSYKNNAGGNSDNFLCSILIDVSGDDTYHSSKDGS